MPFGSETPFDSRDGREWNDGMDDDAALVEVGAEVTRVPTAGEAELIAALLRSCGIEATVAESGRSRPTDVGNRVFVRERDVGLARAILAAPPDADGDLQRDRRLT
jgi:hypothetical protein